MGPMRLGQGVGGQRLTAMLGFGGGGGRMASYGRPGRAASMTADSPVNTETTPPSRGRAQEGDPIGGPLYSGKGSGANGIRRRLMQLNYKNAMDAQAPMWDSINDLIQQANTDRFSPEGRAQFLAPRMQAYDQQERAAQAGALRNQLGRGIDESSYGGNVAATIGSQFGAARAGAINDLYGAEEQRQMQNQALLRDVLMGLQGRSSQQAASVADSITNFKMQQAQLDAMNNPWATLGGIIGGGLGIAGGLGWRPFATPPKATT